jgi:hypothetical protein
MDAATVQKNEEQMLNFQIAQRKEQALLFHLFNDDFIM